MLDVINICLKRIPMESRKHDYKNRTLAAARLRTELEMLSDKVKKLMNFGPHFHICDVSEITEDHIHLESWNHDIKKEEFVEIARLIEKDGYDIEGFELIEIPHPEVFCFANYEKEEYFDVIKLNGKWQFSYLGYAKGDGNSKTLANFPVTSIAEAVEKYLESW